MVLCSSATAVAANIYDDCAAAISSGNTETVNEIANRLRMFNSFSQNSLKQAEACVSASAGEPMVYGPSFDCAKSATRTEYALCDSKDLWAMDQAMASLYFFFRENMTSDLSRNFLNSQRRWLKSRNMCGTNKRCLEEKYQIRLSEFGV